MVVSIQMATYFFHGSCVSLVTSFAVDFDEYTQESVVIIEDSDDNSLISEDFEKQTLPSVTN